MAGYFKRKGVHHLVVKSLCLLFYHIISTATSFHPNCLYMFEAPRMALFRSRRSCDTALVQPLTDLNCNISTIVLIKLMVLSGWNHKRVGFLFESSVRSISCCWKVFQNLEWFSDSGLQCVWAPAGRTHPGVLNLLLIHRKERDSQRHHILIIIIIIICTVWSTG